MMAPQTPRQKPDAEVVHKLIEALQNPDTPQRLEAIAAHQASERRRLRRENYIAVLFNIGFIALVLFLLRNQWAVNRGPGSWLAFLAGCAIAAALLFFAGKRKVDKSKPIPLWQAAIMLAIALSMSFLQSRMSVVLQDSITVIALSAVLVFSGYSLVVTWRSLTNTTTG